MADKTHLVAKPKEILELAKGLLQDMKRLEALNDQLKEDLNQISKSWLDDSFVEVNEYVTKINTILDERKDNISLVAQQLVVYAKALMQTK